MAAQRSYKYRILLADNEPAPADSFRSILLNAGYVGIDSVQVSYDVEIVSNRRATPEETQKRLRTKYYHAAVIDLKLTDDSPTDESGLKLALAEAFPVVRIVLSGFEFQEYRDTVEHQLSRRLVSGIVRLIGKDEQDSEKQLEAQLRELLAVHLGINLELDFTFLPGRSFLDLLGTIHPNPEPEVLNECMVELQDLFRMRFGLVSESSDATAERYSSIYIELLPLRRDGRAWVKIVARTSKSKRAEYFLGVCGDRQILKQERTCFAEYHCDDHPCTHPLEKDTLHYKLRIFPVLRDTYARLRSLNDYYDENVGHREVVTALVGRLFDNVIRMESTTPADDSQDGHLATLALGVEPGVIEAGLRQSLEGSIRADLMEALPGVDLKKLLDLARRQLKKRVQRRIKPTHGGLDLESVYIFDGRIYPLDYTAVKRRAVLYDFVTLELSFRLEKLARKSSPFQPDSPVERALRDGDSDPTIVETRPEEQAAAAVLLAVRNQAGQRTGSSLKTYLEDLLAHTLQAMANYSPDELAIGSPQWTEYLYCVQFADYLVELPELTLGPPKLNFDEKALTIEFNGISADFGDAEALFNIVRYLHDHPGAGGWVSHDDLIKKVIRKDQTTNGELLPDDKDAMYTYVSRSRNLLKKFFEERVHIDTKKRYGYRLEIRPE